MLKRYWLRLKQQAFQPGMAGSGSRGPPLAEGCLVEAHSRCQRPAGHSLLARETCQTQTLVHTEGVVS